MGRLISRLQPLGALASFIVSAECTERAVGLTAQNIIPPGHEWLWWFGAAFWVIVAVSFVFPRG